MALLAPTALRVTQRSDASAAFKVQSVKKGEKSVCHYFTRFSAGSQFCQRLHNNPLCHRERDIDANLKDKQISKHFLKTDVTFLFPSFQFYQ